MFETISNVWPIRDSLNEWIQFMIMQVLDVIDVSKVNPYAAVGKFGQYKMVQKSVKWLKPLQMGTHLKVLSESFPMNDRV